MRILPLGDSITQGNTSNNSYRRPLWQTLNAAGYSVDFVGSLTNNNGGPPPNPDFDLDHEGHWGWRADALLASLPGWLNDYTPDVVLMHVGSNDAFQGQSTSSTVAELEAIIDVLRADNPNVTILLAQLIPNSESGRNSRVNALNAEIPGIVSRKDQAQSRVYLVDQNTGFLLSDLRDRAHPNLAGQQKMAAKWFETLEIVLTTSDTTAPTISSASALGDPTTVTVVFDEAVETASAETVSNYAIDNGVTVSNAALGGDSRTVTLTVSTLVEQLTYTLTVNNVRDRANPPNTIAADSTANFMYADAGGRVTSGLLVLYRFTAGSGSTVFDVSGVGSPMDLSIANPGNASWIGGGGLALTGPTFVGAASDTKLRSNLVQSNALTVEAWVRPDNTTQSGPARMVTFSADGGDRNFTLGQRDSRYEMRLRTTSTNDNGSSPVTRSGSGVVDTVLSHVVYTRTASGQSRIYENGVQVTSRSIGGNFSNWGTNYVFGLGNEIPPVDRPWLGDFHLVAVYDRALDLAEIQQNYAAGQGGPPAGTPPTARAGNDQTVTDTDDDGSEDVTLDGSASSDDGSIVSYQWREGGVVVGNGATPSVTLGVGTHTLTLTVTDDEGLMDSDDVVVTVEAFSDSTAPSAPGTPQASGITEVGVTLDWTAATDAESGIDRYQVLRDASVIAETTGTQFTDSNLTPLTTYRYTVRAINGAGLTGPSSNETLVQTLQGTGGGRVTSGLLVLYRFTAGSGSTVFDVSGVGSPMDLSIANPGNASWIGGGGLALTGPTFVGAASDTKLRSNLVQSNALTVEAWVRPDNTTQSGPARMVTFSADGGDRNFTLGQRDSRYEMRLRTTSTNDNGSSPVTRSGSGVVDTVLSHVVYTRTASGQSRIYENGVQVTSRSIGGNFSNWGTNYVFGLGNEIPPVDRPWLGDFHLVAVYDRALDLAEIQQNYAAGQGGPPAGTPPTARAGNDQTVTDTDDDGSEDVTLDGSASSDDGSIVSYQWREGGVVVGNGATPSVTLGVGTHTLTLTVTDDEGLMDSDDVVVTVEAFSDSTAPSAPGTPQASGITEVGVTLDWTAATDAESGIDRYQVLRDASVIAETTGTQFTDSNLTPLTTYRYTVRAINGAGLTGPSSNETLVQTLLDSVPPQPGERRGG